MNKQEYLALRPNGNEYPMELFYNYFCENGGQAQIQQFMEAFPIWANHVQLTGGMLKVSEKVLNYYDGKFNVVILSDKEGKYLKAL